MTRVWLVPGPQPEGLAAPPGLVPAVRSAPGGRRAAGPEDVHVRLRAGARECRAVLRADPALPGDRLAIGSRCLEALSLPADVPYRLRVDGDTLSLGPVVGILACRRSAELARQLRILLPCCSRYRELGGVVAAFAADGLDRASRTVTGYYYRPGRGGGAWMPATLPYPAAIYRRAAVSRGVRRELSRATGGRTFNVPYFDKWEAWQLLAGDPEVVAHLPETRDLTGPGDVIAMLKRHPAVVLKPHGGRKGEGVALVTQGGTAITVAYRRGFRNRRQVLEDPEQLGACLRRLTRGRRYLVQRAVPLMRRGGRPVDFRLMMQKVPGGRWVCQGIVARRAARGRVVTNASDGGRVLRLEDALPAAGDGPAVRLEPAQAMVRAAVAACEALDRRGVHCGDLGFDVGLDAAGHPWILEVNNRAPAPTLALLARDRALYRTVKSGPVVYAAWLAGFSPAPACPARSVTVSSEGRRPPWSGSSSAGPGRRSSPARAGRPRRPRPGARSAW